MVGYPILRRVIKKFLRMRAAVRWAVGIDKTKVRLPRFFVGRLLTTVLPQLLLALLQLGVDLSPVFINPFSLLITSLESNVAELNPAIGELTFKSLGLRTACLFLVVSSRFSREGLNVKPTMPSSLARGRTDLELFQYWLLVGGYSKMKNEIIIVYATFF